MSRHFETRLPDRYESVRLLGEGGMGVVYEVLDHVRREAVALKTVRHASAESHYRLKQEFRALADVEHPNLVRLFDLFVDGDACFFTMELLTGVDIATHVAERASEPIHREELPIARRAVAVDDDAETIHLARLDESATRPREERPRSDAGAAPRADHEAIRKVLTGLLRGLSALHDAGLLHRDLKPSNVKVTDDGRVVLLDFGLVADRNAAAQVTSSGGLAGTVAYMAPEQARAEPEITPACDLYAVGVILYELLTGRLPFVGSMYAVLARKQTEAAVAPREIDPSVPPDLDGLCRRLMALDPHARPSIDEALGILGTRRDRAAGPWTRSMRSLVGRSQERARLEACHRSCERGRPSIALVRGRAGIGKSTLIEGFARGIATRARGVVLSGRCYESESVPFKGLDGVVDALSRVLTKAGPEELERVLPPNVGDLATLFPVLLRIPRIEAAYHRVALAERVAKATRDRAFECLRELLGRISEATPLLVVIDDVQWADEDSTRGIEELVRGDRAPAMMLLLASRPTDSPVVRSLFPLGTTSAAERTLVELGPLSVDDIRAIAEERLGRDSALLDYVARDAHGVPLVATELVRFLGEDHGSDASFELPSFEALVSRRVAALAPVSRDLLELLAVAGEPTSSRLLLRALRLDERDRAPIDDLLERAFARELRATGAWKLDFAHDRVRESVLESIPSERTASLHRGLALALELLATPPHDRLARHFAAASDRPRGSAHARAAAAQAAAALAFGRATELYELAIALADDAALPLRNDLANVLASAGRYEDAARAYLDIAARSDGPAAREGRRRAAECWLYAGRIDDGLGLLDEVASEIGVRIPEGRWPLAWEILKRQVLLLVRGLSFVARRQDEIPREVLERVRVLRSIAVQYLPIDPVRGSVPALRYLRAALDAGEVDEIVTALALEASARSVSGWISGARRVTTALDAIAANVGSVEARATSLMSRSIVALMSGERRTAVTLASEALALLTTLPSTAPWRLSLAHFVAAMGHVFEIRTEALVPMVEYVREREQHAGPFAEIRLSSAISYYHFLVAQAARVLDITDGLRWSAATTRDIVGRAGSEMSAAAALHCLGDFEAARERAESAIASYRRQGIWHVTFLRGAVLCTLASCGLALGEPDLVRRALRMVGRPRDDLGGSYRRMLAAMAAVAAGDALGARVELRALRDVAVRAGFPVYEATACWALGTLDPGEDGAESRVRYVELVGESGMIDADRFFWGMVPIGSPPKRTGTSELAWSRRVAPIRAPRGDEVEEPTAWLLSPRE